MKLSMKFSYNSHYLTTPNPLHMLAFHLPGRLQKATINRAVITQRKLKTGQAANVGNVDSGLRGERTGLELARRASIQSNIRC